jgi:hypothetical protein
LRALSTDVQKGLSKALSDAVHLAKGEIMMLALNIRQDSNVASNKHFRIQSHRPEPGEFNKYDVAVQ